MSLGGLFGRAQASSSARDQKLARLAQMAAMGTALRQQKRDRRKSKEFDLGGAVVGGTLGALTGGPMGGLAGAFSGGSSGKKGDIGAAAIAGLGAGLSSAGATGKTGPLTKGLTPGGLKRSGLVLQGLQDPSKLPQIVTELGVSLSKPADLKNLYTTKEVQNEQGETVIAHVPTPEGLSAGVETIYTDVKTGAKKTQEVKTRDDYVDDGYRVASKSQAKTLKNRAVTAADTGDKMIKILPLPATQTRALADMDIALSVQEDALSEMESLGIKPDPVTGRIPFVGDTVNIFTKSPEWQAWQAKVERAFQKYRKITTGAQASDKEIARLMPLMPSSKDLDPETYTLKALQVIDEMRKSKSIILRTFEDAGYDIGNLGSGATNTGASADPLGIL